MFYFLINDLCRLLIVLYCIYLLRALRSIQEYFTYTTVSIVAKGKLDSAWVVL